MVVDTPGIYGLRGDSPDEEVTVKLLKHDNRIGQMDAAIVCVDATQLERHLPLVYQVQALGWPVVVAMTMHDLEDQSGVLIDVEELSLNLGVPVVGIDGRHGAGVEELVGVAREAGERCPVPVELSREQAAAKAKALASRSVRRRNVTGSPLEKSVRLDRWLLHPVWGIVFFLLVTTSLFTAVFWLADPLMGLVDSGFSWLGEWTHGVMGGTLAADFVADGLIASFGAVLVFVPQILVLFFLLGILEDSGYLARAATLVDRPLAAVGLSGRAFVPLLSGYACAVPAIMAARTIRSKRERWIAISIIPLLSCSARLPVYALLLTFLFTGAAAWKAGLTLSMIYIGSLLVGGIAAAILDRIAKGREESSFMLELPIYRAPKWRVVARNAALRTQSYVKRAGPVIFTLAVILWFASNYPRPEIDLPPAQAIQQSYAGQLGRMIEPVFEPMGVDWRVGFGLISAFAAREVFVSAMALVFDVTTDGEEETIRGALLGKMREATLADGTPVFTMASVIGLILFFMIALQCTSTTAVVGKETGSWRFAVMQVLVLNVVAYVVSVLVVQLLR
jgi:ferrous iron transport protein B